MLELIITIVVAFLSIPVFINISERLLVFDHPNERSSHNVPTPTGAGLIIFVVITVDFLFHIQSNWIIWIALTLGAAVGFIDDHSSLPVGWRTLLYGISMILICYYIYEFYELSFTWLLPFLVVVGLGAVNAYNFMDGINGITISYTTLLLITAYLLDAISGLELNKPLLFSGIMGCLAVGYLNFRTNALAFLGDIGSVLLGFLVIYFVAALIAQAQSVLPLALLMIYGVDTIITIVERLLKKENIFQAHRSHLYQLLSNELGFHHLSVSLLYIIAQALINLFIVVSMIRHWPETFVFICLTIGTGTIYLFVKFAMVKPRIEKINL